MIWSFMVYTPNIIMTIKLRMIWQLVRQRAQRKQEPHKQMPLRGTRHRWNGNIYMDLIKTWRGLWTEVTFRYGG